MYNFKFNFSSDEGEKLKEFQYPLKLDNDGHGFMLFPTTISHVIDEQSPLYNMSAIGLQENKYFFYYLTQTYLIYVFLFLF